MSQRFGRNQKRKMQQQIDPTKLQVEHQVRTLAFVTGEQGMLSERLRRAMASLETVAEVLGDHFVGLPPKTIDVEYIMDVMRLPKSMSLATLMPLSGQGLMDAVEYSVYQLDMHRAELETDRLSGSRSLHAFYRTEKGELRYGMTSDAMRRISKDDLIRYIASSFAGQLKRDSGSAQLRATSSHIGSAPSFR